MQTLSPKPALYQPINDAISCQSTEELLGWRPGSTNRGGRFCTVDLLIKVACFVKKGK